MKKNAQILILILLIILSVTFLGNKDKEIKTPAKNYEVILVNTEESRQMGLSGMKELPKEKVMFFSFDKEDYYGIWMKDMLFNIDIVFLDKDYTVVSYYDDVSPETYPTIFYPEKLSKYVIEMNAGERIKAKLEKGSKVYYK